MAPSFKPGEPGTYMVQRIVNDGTVDSPVQIQVYASAFWLTDQIRDVIGTICGLSNEAFKNRTMRNLLILDLVVVTVEVHAIRYKCAQKRLQEDIIPRINGCAGGGSPDRNDWIIACQYQEMIYPDLMDIAGHLAELAGQ